MLRYLRTAVAALSLTACMLLIALWVRSHRTLDLLELYYGYGGAHLLFRRWNRVLRQYWQNRVFQTRNRNQIQSRSRKKCNAYLSMDLRGMVFAPSLAHAASISCKCLTCFWR